MEAENQLGDSVVQDGNHGGLNPDVVNGNTHEREMQEIYWN